MKTIRARLKTGEVILCKDVVEFLIGRFFFCFVSKSKGTQSFPVENIMSVDYLTKGGFYPVNFKKKVKSNAANARLRSSS